MVSLPQFGDWLFNGRSFTGDIPRLCMPGGLAVISMTVIVSLVKLLPVTYLKKSVNKRQQQFSNKKHVTVSQGGKKKLQRLSFHKQNTGFCHNYDLNSFLYTTFL